MTKTQLIKHALKLWNVPYVPREVNRANARKWLKSVDRLGDRWLFAKKYTREELKARMQ